MANIFLEMGWFNHQLQAVVDSPTERREAGYTYKGKSFFQSPMPHCGVSALSFSGVDMFVGTFKQLM